jgi:hypothetical protein
MHWKAEWNQQLDESNIYQQPDKLEFNSIRSTSILQLGLTFTLMTPESSICIMYLVAGIYLTSLAILLINLPRYGFSSDCSAR